jgi:phage-related protein
VFVCRTPFGRARGYESTSLDMSTSPTSQSVVNSGTYAAQPVVTLNFSAASSVKAVLLENLTTGESITYTGAIAASDILIFDSETKAVTLNGTAVDFSGAFPTLEVGANLLRLTVSGASFMAYTTYAHLPAFL